MKRIGALVFAVCENLIILHMYVDLSDFFIRMK